MSKLEHRDIRREVIGSGPDLPPDQAKEIMAGGARDKAVKPEEPEEDNSRPTRHVPMTEEEHERNMARARADRDAGRDAVMGWMISEAPEWPMKRCVGERTDGFPIFQQELDDLRAENERLRRKLAELEDRLRGLQV